LDEEQGCDDASNPRKKTKIDTTGEEEKIDNEGRRINPGQ